MASKDEAQEPVTLKGVIVTESGKVKVWSEVRIYVPIPTIDYGMVGFTFGHERLADSGSQESIRRAELLCDEFNEATLERRLTKLIRQIRKTYLAVEVEDRPKKERKRKGGSVQDRANKRLRK